MSAERTVETLARLAREAEPPPLARDRAAEMIARAARAAPVRVPMQRSAWPAAAAAALVLLGLGAWWSSSGVEVASPSSVTLPTGDRLVAAAGTRFDLLSVTGPRRVRVEDGTVAFDVAPLASGNRFEVETPELVAHVVGTVFTVEASRGRSIVRVYEGHVRVEARGATHELAAGESVAIGAERAAHADAMEAVAREMAARRTRARPAVAPSEAAIEPPSIDVAPPPRPRSRAPRDAPQTGPRSEPRPSADDARSWLAAGDRTRALDAARAAIARGEPEGPWRMIEGDALRGLRRPDEAAIAYERASEDASLRAQAGFVLARLRARDLHDPRGALAALDRCAPEAEGSALAERALGLRIDLLGELGRATELEAASRAYLERFPSGPRARDLRDSAR